MWKCKACNAKFAHRTNKNRNVFENKNNFRINQISE